MVESETEIQSKIDKVTETITGYPVKNLTYHGKLRKYIGGLVKDPLRKGTVINEGYSGVSWDIKGKCITTHHKTNKVRSDLDIKF